MRVIRIYQPGEYATGTSLDLSPEASQHVGTVLRMQIGEPLTLFCGNNMEFLACITEVNKKKVRVTITSAHEVNRESPLNLHLAQAISKGDRMEWVVQKAVELGVSAITPLITEYCVVKLDKDRMAKKLHQWQSIAIAACEQSGRNTVPEIRPIEELGHFIQHINSDLKFILDPTTKKNWRDVGIKQKNVALLIGPEGGLSSNEILLAKQHGFNSLSLGPRILRTETAAISALTLVQALGGDL